MTEAKKHLRVSVNKLLRMRLSASRVSAAILKELGRKSSGRARKEVADVIRPHFSDYQDRYGVMIVQKVFCGHLHREGEYLIIPHEKGNKNNWREKGEIPQPRHVVWDNANELLYAKVESILFDLKQYVFEDEEPDERLAKAVMNAVTDEQRVFLVSVVDHHLTYF